MISEMDIAWTQVRPSEVAVRAGFRFGDKGTHTSRTIMLAELTDTLEAVPDLAGREDYRTAIVDDNVLRKETASNRRLTNQRLGELYGLDGRIPMFRVLHRLWGVDEAGRPLLAILCALARDPLLRATAPAVLGLANGQELVRASFLDVIRQSIGTRLNSEILDKVARNAGASWTQSGHLTGRIRKLRRPVDPTPASVAFASWLGAQCSLAGEALLSSPWMTVLDRSPQTILDLVLRAKQLGLLRAMVSGGVVEIDTTALDLAKGVRR